MYVLGDEKELMTNLIVAASQDYLSSIITWKTWLKWAGSLITITDSKGHAWLKATKIKSNNNDEQHAEVMLANMHENFKETCCVCGKRGHKKENFPQNTSETEKTQEKVQR